ncbi:MAG: hypothetical protein LBK43_02710, partial [Treponema sp.]|nr:hypothetical protein [Treponema sp.]
MKTKLWKPLLGLVLVAGYFASCGDESVNHLSDTYLNVSYEAHDLQKLDIKYPKEPDLITEPLNAVLFIHGGSWIGGDKGEYQVFIDALGANSGWV